MYQYRIPGSVSETIIHRFKMVNNLPTLALFQAPQPTVVGLKTHALFSAF